MYLLIIFLSTVFSFTGLFFVVKYTDPFRSGVFGLPTAIILFYVTLFFSLTGVFTLIFFYIKVFLSKNEIYFKYINNTLRQGVFLSTIFLISLAFERFKVLNWLTAILLFLIFSLTEVYIYIRNKEIK